MKEKGVIKMRKRKKRLIYYVMVGIMIVPIGIVMVPVLIFVAYYIALEIFNLSLIDIHKKINSHYDVNISTEWDMKFAERLGFWFDDYNYFVFVVDSENQEFFEDFSQERNDEFEKDVNYWLKYSLLKNKTTEEFLFDLAKPYSWHRRDDYEDKFVYFIYQSNNLYVLAFW